MSANNFILTLDTIAPTGSITKPDQSKSVSGSISLTLTTGGANYMKVWAEDSSSAAPSSAPSNINWVPANTSYQINFGTDGDYKLYAVFMDDVGNVSNVVTTTNAAVVIRSDRVAPTINNTQGHLYAYDWDDPTNHTFTNGSTGTGNEYKFGIHLEITDDFSGLKEVVVSCSDFENSVIIPGSSFNSTTHIYEGPLYFASGTTDGSKTITITAYDQSGNSSSATTSIYLDKAISTTTAVLKVQASDQDGLPTWVNETINTNKFVAVITTTDTDIVSYQFYGDLQDYGTATWADWTPANGTYSQTKVITNLAFTATEGTKHVYVILKDRAGNISSAPTIEHIYDVSDPTVDIYEAYPDVSAANAATAHVDDLWIAAGAGTKNVSRVYFNYSDSSGIASVSFDYQKGSGSWTPITVSSAALAAGYFDFSATANLPSDVPAAGDYTVRITVVDNAGNSASDSLTIHIEETFTIDSVVLGGYGNEVVSYAYVYSEATEDDLYATVTNSVAPGSGRYRIWAWSNGTENDTDPASDYLSWDSSSKYIASTSIVKHIEANSASNWLHIKAMSNVGNVVYVNVSFTADHTAPTFNLGLKTGTSVPTNSRTININIANISDDFGTVDKMRVYPAANTTFASGGTNGWVAPAEGNRTIELSSNLNSGTYGVTVEVIDRAGNTASHTLNWEYDAVAPQGTVVLKEANGTDAKASPTANKQFRAVVTYTVDPTDTYNNIQYLLWGKFSLTDGGAEVTEANAVWTDLSANSITTNVLYATANASATGNGEEKTVYCKLREKDNPSVVTNLTSASFIYNPMAAVLMVDNVTDFRISCVHTFRKQTSGGVVSDQSKYADIVSFDVDTVNGQALVELQVAAFTVFPSQDFDGSDLTTQKIVATTGSNGGGYHQTGNPLTLPAQVIIDGKDYRAALGGSDQTNVDGDHYVVVFGKNTANVWSVAGFAISSNSELDD